ncbi:MAG: RNA polymerase sigma factor [Ruminococcaceae bacterium]|nr:RNA polymerase sigma factor [Oscillospiraceae bacterium]MBQ9914252.1 RNA polymerase sigma factor [Clostridia bacterium]
MQKKKEIISERVLSAEYEAVYRYVLCLCRDETAAKDITQEAFLKAMKGRESFAGESSLYTWLCAIAKRVWLTSLKRQGRESPAEIIGDVLPSEEASPEDLAAEKDTAMYIHRLVHQLEEPYKEVFSLRVFGELSFSEIADLFSKTDSWARVTYHRAKKTITEKMRKDGYYE